jgi:hypothetical protein
MAAFAHVARRAEHTPAAHDVFFVPLRGGRGGQLGENWARPQARGPSGKRKGPGRFGRRIKRMDDQKRVHALQSPTRTARRQSTAQEP